MGMLQQTKSMLSEVDAVRESARRNNEFFGTSLPMIASENILSPRAQEMLVTDFHGRYAEGLPGKRYYQGCQFFDEVESRAIDLAKRLFRCNFANVQPTSGTVSNMAVLKALVKPGDDITALSTAAGGHISHAKMGAVGLRGLKVTEYPWDLDNMRLDVDGTVKLLRQLKPKLALFGGSVILFPTPLKGELADTCHEVGAHVMFDAAHVLGLVAGGRFQDPLHEGADVMTGSTHKTLPGPQGGIVLSDHAGTTEEDAKFLKGLDAGVFPGTNSSYHLHHVAAKAVALAEHIEFGAAYATQIIKNAKALAAGLVAEGFKVFGEARGYTDSHQCLVQVGNVGEGKGRWAAELLEQANIVTNMNLVPGDTKAMNPSGLRLGTQELTRIGMKEPQMREIAALYGKVLLKGVAADKVGHEVRTLRAQFKRVEYCFNEKNLGGYEFHRLT
ncbi:MAG TPA: serine hydroxymethyltransferase [Candidatus Thermoplasmatota archaeon]|nr:serine hydroxymethyltransferase [Candidatus Thermoplasmatota archaeon]